MRRRVCLSGAIALFCLGFGQPGPQAAIAEDASSLWLPEHGQYVPTGSFEAGGSTFQIWQLDAGGQPAERGASETIVLRTEHGTVSEAYDFARETSAVGSDIYSVRRRTQAGDWPGSRMAEAADGPDRNALAYAPALLARLLEVEGPWREGARLLEEARQADLAGADLADAHLAEADLAEADAESMRVLLRRAARALGRARDLAPWHLGIVGDLLDVYQLLLPYEAGTDRGANISFLWREACAQWQSGALTEFERSMGKSCEFACAFAEGSHLLAAHLATDAELQSYANLAPVESVLAAMGAMPCHLDGRTTVSGPRGAVDLVELKVEGARPSSHLPWQRRAYIVYAQGSRGPSLPVWYSLSLEGDATSPRWALIGWVGASRRVLRVYGPEEPAAYEVSALVRGLIQQVADAEGVR